MEETNHQAQNQLPPFDKLRYIEENSNDISGLAPQGYNTINKANEFLNKVKRVTSASKRRIKLRSMHDVAQFIGSNQEGAKATKSFLNDELALT